MNLEILSNPQVLAWLKDHAKDNVYDLAFKPSPFEGIEMTDLVKQIQGRQIASKKLPLLASNEQVIYPPKINLEQTSSDATAAYKAQLIKGEEIIDITGGLGIDALFFAESFETVFHIEQQQPLQAIASHNFKVLQKDNIQSIHTNGIEFLKENLAHNDVLYVDPARRDAHQKKVFLLEDLSPNTLNYIEEWTDRFREVWIKLSPMIDLSYLIKTIPNLSHIYLVAVKNELKEVLIAIQKNIDAQITAVNLETKEPPFHAPWDFSSPVVSYSELKKYIYEPNAAIQKSGLNDFLVKTFNLNKLHPNTQLFTSNDLISSFPGRVFEITSTVHNPKKELKGQSIQAIHRNFPEALNKLKKKYKFTTDGISPIIFTQTQNKVSILKAELIAF